MPPTNLCDLLNAYAKIFAFCIFDYNLLGLDVLCFRFFVSLASDLNIWKGIFGFESLSLGILLCVFGILDSGFCFGILVLLGFRGFKYEFKFWALDFKLWFFLKFWFLILGLTFLLWILELGFQLWIFGFVFLGFNLYIFRAFDVWIWTAFFSFVFLYFD